MATARIRINWVNFVKSVWWANRQENGKQATFKNISYFLFKQINILKYLFACPILKLGEVLVMTRTTDGDSQVTNPLGLECNVAPRGICHFRKTVDQIFVALDLKSIDAERAPRNYLRALLMELSHSLCRFIDLFLAFRIFVEVRRRA